MGDRIEGVDEPDDAGAERNPLATQAIGVTRPIPALMMVPDDWQQRSRQSERPADPLTDLGMTAEDRPLLRRQRARLEKDRLGNPDLADIVQHGTVGQRLPLLTAETN